MNPRNLLVSAFGAALLTGTAATQGNVWQPLLPFGTVSQPQVRLSAAIAYDSDRDRIVTCAGRINASGSNIYPQETWEFDGVDWHLIGTVGPIAFGGYNSSTNIRAYYDSQRHVTVAIESAQAGPTNFMEWNGSTWTTVLSVPNSVFHWRFAFDVAYDPIRGVAVLFGGYDSSNELGDTWEFNGSTFVQVSGFGPQARWGHAMAYDSSRGVVVLYGGRNGPQLSDMWDWNGSSWQPTPNAAGPGARAFHTMAYDHARSRLVLFGNDGAGSAQTWEWQPSGWTLAPATNSVRSNSSAIYDSRRERVVSFGGSGPSLNSGPTTTFGFGEVPNAATVSAFGVGCAGPSGVPQLAAINSPTFGATFSLQFSNVPPGPLSMVFGWVGFDDTTWNGNPLPAPLGPLFPGCTAYIAPLVSYSLGIGVNGMRSWQMPIPFMPMLSGLSIYLQGGVYAPNFNPGQAIFTNALAGTLGS
ncbi:MAG: hypothetical protein H6838_04085 [Planctomycetes bacterium]|nr:hypothetical protein [Planctomycetota bacterium]